MTNNVYAIIMAGGRGERFWPLSTEAKPKPFLRFMGDKTLFQATVERLGHFISEDRLLPVLAEQHLALAREQVPHIPERNYIVEPIGRDTAACLGLASLYLEQMDPTAVMLVLPADHYIQDEGEFISCLKTSIAFLSRENRIVTIGIRPTRPEVGYGYIEAGSELAPGVDRVTRFVEKPSIAKAREYVAKPNYYWNSGMFIWRNNLIQSLLSRFMPDHWRVLDKIRQSIGTVREKATVEREYEKLEKISIDHGVLEKTEDIAVVPAKFRWDDIGNWAALTRLGAVDGRDNFCLGKHIVSDAKNCVVYSPELPIAAFGVSDLVIVAANDRLLVCSKDVAPQLKKLVREHGLKMDDI